MVEFISLYVIKFVSKEFLIDTFVSDMNCNFLITVLLLLSSALGPIFSYLWLNGGLANANFYFGTSLAFNAAQVFLIVDLLFTHSKRDYIINNHKKLKSFDVVLVS